MYRAQWPLGEFLERAIGGEAAPEPWPLDGSADADKRNQDDDGDEAMTQA